MFDFLQVQGITSLTIGEEGNPLYTKNWRPYAIFRWLNSSNGDYFEPQPRLEHWGLLYVNNQEVRLRFTWKELTKRRSFCTWEVLCNKNEIVFHLEGISENETMLHLEGLNENEIRFPTMRSSLPMRPTEVLESLLSWRFPSLRYSDFFCVGTFLSRPFFGTSFTRIFWDFSGPIYDLESGTRNLELTLIQLVILAFQKSQVLRNFSFLSC